MTLSASTDHPCQLAAYPACCSPLSLSCCLRSVSFQMTFCCQWCNSCCYFCSQSSCSESNMADHSRSTRSSSSGSPTSCSGSLALASGLTHGEAMATRSLPWPWRGWVVSHAARWARDSCSHNTCTCPSRGGRRGDSHSRAWSSPCDGNDKACKKVNLTPWRAGGVGPQAD